MGWGCQLFILACPCPLSASLRRQFPLPESPCSAFLGKVEAVHGLSLPEEEGMEKIVLATGIEAPPASSGVPSGGLLLGGLSEKRQGGLFFSETNPLDKMDPVVWQGLKHVQNGSSKGDDIARCYSAFRRRPGVRGRLWLISCSWAGRLSLLL